MIAALPMYDRPELRRHTDAFWGAIRDALRQRGIDAPDALTRDRDPWDIWQDPTLLFAQTCGLPYRTRLHARVQLIASPDFGLPGCGPGFYNSVILSGTTALPATPRIAVNDAFSQSGWAALFDWSERVGQPLGTVTVTGSHAASARAVADGQADLCAVDAQTWRLISRFDRPTGLFEIARTDPTPALPYITGAAQDAAILRVALSEALRILDPEQRRALNLAGVVSIPPADYLSVPIPPNL